MFRASEGAQHSAKEGKMALAEAKKILGLSADYKVSEVTEVPIYLTSFVIRNSLLTPACRNTKNYSQRTIPQREGLFICNPKW